jgi:lysozyme family protein
MKSDFTGALQFVLNAEGGFSVDPVPTNKGIEQDEYNIYLHANGLTLTSVENITTAQATEIYHDNYWTPIHGNYLLGAVSYALFNYAVNTGISQALKFLQGVLGIEQTGEFDSATSSAYWAWQNAGHSSITLATGIIERSTDFYNWLAANIPADKQFDPGWLARNAHLQALINGLPTS